MNAASPYKDFRSYLAAAKANPGKISIGHSGNGTTNHIAILQLEDALKIQLNVVAYKGSGAYVNDLLGGQVPAAVDAIADLTELHRAGKIRILASSGDITGIFCRAGIPLRETLNNGNYPDWQFVTEYRVPVGTEEWAVDQQGDELSKAVSALRDGRGRPMYRLVYRVKVPDAPPVEIWRRN